MEHRTKRRGDRVRLVDYRMRRVPQRGTQRGVVAMVTGLPVAVVTRLVIAMVTGPLASITAQVTCACVQVVRHVGVRPAIVVILALLLEVIMLIRRRRS